MSKNLDGILTCKQLIPPTQQAPKAAKIGTDAVPPLQLEKVHSKGSKLPTIRGRRATDSAIPDFSGNWETVTISTARTEALDAPPNFSKRVRTQRRRTDDLEPSTPKNIVCSYSR